jgi:acyl-CoA synthetase (AMP-forming)/AMP-acid ligase II/acyl carrier protein
MMNYNFNNMVELLLDRAELFSDKVACRFLADGEQETTQLTYRMLWQKTQVIAQFIKEQKVSPNERALVLYPAGLDYLPVMFACMTAGIIPVPIYPAKNLPKLQYIARIAKACQAKIIFTHHDIDQAIRFFAEKIPDLSQAVCHCIDSLHLDAPSTKFISPQVQEIAFLQFTSGSTGNPKGVMVTHQNLLLHGLNLHERFGCQPDDGVVSWLPQYHDMGLIGMVMQTIFEGTSIVLMPPTAFLSKPLRWLKTISDYQAKYSSAPNFAYQLCIDRISDEEKSTLDLSSWKVGINGSDTIHEETIKKFNEAFGSCGFKPNAMFPGYGLAEATLIVSSKKEGEELKVNYFSKESLEEKKAILISEHDEHAVAMVSCGKAFDNQPLSIVNPDTFERCPEGEVGEIWISGPIITKGYWDDPEKTEQVFQAVIRGDALKTPHMRTGDLGFIFENELYFSTRMKNLIVLNGKNYYPEDIELVIENDVPELSKHSIACAEFHKDNKNGIIVVTELVFSKNTHDYPDICSRILHLVNEHFSVPVLAIGLLKPGGMPKTTSGKIQREQILKQLLNKELLIAYQWPPIPLNEDTKQSSNENLNYDSDKEISSWLTNWLETHIIQPGVPGKHFDFSKSFIYNGLDSISLGELVYELETTFQCYMSYQELHETESINAFIKKIQQNLNKSNHHGIIKYTPLLCLPNGPKFFPVSFLQQYWLTRQIFADLRKGRITLALEVDGSINTSQFERAVTLLVEQNEILRTTFAYQLGQLVQVVHGRGECTVEKRIIHEPDPHQLKLLIEQETIRVGSIECNFAKMPLFNIELLHVNDLRTVIIISIHHLCSDVLSIRLILKELNSFYLIAEEKKTMKELQYADFTMWQRTTYTESYLQRYKDFWQKYLDAAPALKLPYTKELITQGTPHPKQFHQRVPISHSDVLTFSKSNESTPFVLYFLAFLVTAELYTAQQDILVSVPRSGRDIQGSNDLIGFIASTALFRFQLKKELSVEETLNQLNETNNALQENYLPFELIRSFNTQLKMGLSYHILFEYVSTPIPTHIFGLLIKNQIIPATTYDHDLIWHVSVIENKVQLSISYDENKYSQESINEFALSWSTVLQTILSSSAKTLISNLAHAPKDSFDLNKEF